MEQGTETPTVHPLKLLAYAYGLMPEIEIKLQPDQAEAGGLMKLEVRLFARARDAAGAERVTRRVARRRSRGRPAGRLGRRYPRNCGPWLPACSLPWEPTTPTIAVPFVPESEVACFPPVSGG